MCMDLCENSSLSADGLIRCGLLWYTMGNVLVIVVFAVGDIKYFVILQGESMMAFDQFKSGNGFSRALEIQFLVSKN